MARRVDDDDDDDDDYVQLAAPYRASWENAKTAAEVRAVLGAFEDAPPIDDAVRLTLQRWLYRQDKFFGGGGAGQITMVLRVFLESEVNRDALVEPILSAVSWAKDPAFAKHGLALLDAFDQIKLTELLATMRGLDVFSEKSIRSYLSTAIRNKVVKILEPEAKPSKPAKVKPAPKPPLSVTRVPQIEKAISLGKELLAVRSSISSNTQFGREVRRRFPGVDQITASESMKVARAYGARPEIYRRLSWIALFELSSPKMSPSVRQAIEAEILAGKSVSATEIRRVRGRLKPGSPKRRPSEQPVQRQSNGASRRHGPTSRTARNAKWEALIIMTAGKTIKAGLISRPRRAP